MKHKLPPNGIQTSKAELELRRARLSQRLQLSWVEREHEWTRRGAYWQSYDFAKNTDRQNIFEHPSDFEQAGGEVIFSLPNGLQAYLLVDKDGNRLEKAPIEIVRDPNGLFPQVHNRLSCMACHSEGMISFIDKSEHLRRTIEANDNGDEEASTLLALYVPAGIMRRLLDEDTKRFANAVERAGAVAGGRETIIRLVERFSKSLSLGQAAAMPSVWTMDWINLNIREITQFPFYQSNRCKDLANHYENKTRDKESRDLEGEAITAGSHASQGQIHSRAVGFFS